MNATTLNYESMINQLPFLCAWMDKYSNIIAINQFTLDTFKFKSLDEVIGRNHFDQPWREYAHEFIEQDKFSLMGNVQFNVDKTVKMDGTNAILLTKKAPFINENAIQGVVCAGFELTKESYHHIVSFLSSNNVNLSDFHSKVDKKSEFEYKGVQFTKRQAQIIGYMLRGKTSEATAKILHRSHRTIEKHIEQIREKLDCESKSDIIEKAFNLGFIDLMFLEID